MIDFLCFYNRGMCGIFAVSAEPHKQAGEVVIEGIKKLEYRGYDSWGVAIRTSNTISVQKKVGKISEAKVSFAPSAEAIGHSRWATHGGVTDDNAHPHTAGKITVVHNGIFENYQESKEKMIALGRVFTSQTDTEVIAHCIDQHIIEGKSLIEAVRITASAMRGRFALLVMMEGQDGIIAARRGSPLIVGRTPNETFVASDITAFLAQTKVVNYLDDDEMAIVEGNNVRFVNIINGESLEKRDITVQWEVELAEKGDYAHFMIKEIFDQKSSIADAINHTEEEIMALVQKMKEGNGVYLIACGTAHKMCWAAEYFFARVAGRKVNVVPASEMKNFERFVNDKTVLFAVSQSGETADVLEILEHGKLKNAKVVSITNVESSSIARISDVHLPLRAGVEKAVASTKAATSQMALLLLLAYADAGRLNEGRQLLHTLVSSVNDMLNPRYEQRVQEIAQQICSQNNTFIIGRNALYPIALESAIKIMEVSYIHAQGFAAGEMKHGPIALIEPGSPCIVLGDDEETASNAMELKARGGFIIGISPKKQDVFDAWLKVPDGGEAQAIASLLPVQLLSYQLAILRGVDPDMPRNLAKSVTVK